LSPRLSRGSARLERRAVLAAEADALGVALAAGGAHLLAALRGRELAVRHERRVVVRAAIGPRRVAAAAARADHVLARARVDRRRRRGLGGRGDARRSSGSEISTPGRPAMVRFGGRRRRASATAPPASKRAASASAI